MSKGVSSLSNLRGSLLGPTGARLERVSGGGGVRGVILLAAKTPASFPLLSLCGGFMDTVMLSFRSEVKLH